MKLTDMKLVSKLAIIALKTKNYRTYKKQIRRINPILKANGREELSINSKKKRSKNCLNKIKINEVKH